MGYKIQDADIEILRKAGVSEDDIKHCVKVIYADRLVDIIMDGIVPIKSEVEAEELFEEILRTYLKYGKNEKTLNRYLGYHREIQGLLAS